MNENNCCWLSHLDIPPKAWTRITTAATIWMGSLAHDGWTIGLPMHQDMVLSNSVSSTNLMCLHASTSANVGELTPHSAKKCCYLKARRPAVHLHTPTHRQAQSGFAPVWRSCLLMLPLRPLPQLLIFIAWAARVPAPLTRRAPRLGVAVAAPDVSRLWCSDGCPSHILRRGTGRSELKQATCLW